MDDFKGTRILLVEDDQSLGSVLREYLELKGFVVTLSENGEEGAVAFRNGLFDLAILDVMMPKKDGFTLATEIREKNQRLPIIFLTAKSMQEDKLQGFKVGGDDYLTKPFSMEELLLRMRAVLRRVQPANGNSTVFQLGKHSFDSQRQVLSNNGNSQKLTTKESAILQLLCRHQNEVVTRERLLKNIWGDDDYFKGRSMDVFITKIRKHLKEEPAVELINVHGTGFKLVVKD